ncbi:MAG: argininosuccinate lyase [Phycisphaerales bacterium]|nr:argininosuccinate lyase [Phycisphaerales bacterium]
MSTPTRLWDKGGDLDALVHRFTVGDDPVWDLHLLHWDCVGSAAHARTLHAAGLLADAECDALLAALADIDRAALVGSFPIPPEQEDCHTAIEVALTERCGEAGRKIHTGRSRNDQVAAAMRLYLRHATAEWLRGLAELADELAARLSADGAVPMPGYTHLQPAMPSSVGQWLHAHLESVLEQGRAAVELLGRLDSCPLGTGAGFGVGLPLDRALTARLLGFSRPQRSPIDVQNSRGRLEKYFVRVGSDIAAALARLAADLILFNTAEFGFVTLPEALTTGSSIMPQKRNPDVLELLRARAARSGARAVELEWISAKLTSSYHRDLQLTKEPALRTAVEVRESLAVAARTLAGVRFERAALAAALRPELYATQAAYGLVQQGVPFREAYRRVAEEVRRGTFDAAPWRATAEAAARVAPADGVALQDEVQELRAAAVGAEQQAAVPAAIFRRSAELEELPGHA